jgi:RNA polymerase sigma factor (TIGR02999 family)
MCADAGDDAPVEPEGARESADALLRRMAYEDLLRMAHAERRSDPFATLSTRTLLHEAFLKLAAAPPFRVEDQGHLRGILRRAMRQVLVDSARKRRTAKRSGVMVTADDDIPDGEDTTDLVIALHEALETLERLDPRQASVIEARFFCGYTIAETAAQLGVSESTVKDDYRAASAWLASNLRST